MADSIILIVKIICYISFSITQYRGFT